MLTPLPIDAHVPSLIERLRASPGLVLVAEPGAGKTTRVPWALLDAGLAGDREVVVLQPRRIAARLAARRVADERGVRLGERVGYQVRFEDVTGPRTRLRFVTEGVLTRQLLSEPTLPRVGIAVLDEFHERHLDGDLALALLRRLQQGPRPDLKVVAMSATLDAEPLARYLDAPAVSVAGRPYEVAIEHQPLPEQRPLDQQVASALRRLVEEGLDGDVLVFLPGAFEIRKAREACEPIAERAGLMVVALHGDLPPAEQDRAVSRSDRRKVILSTNVAETSVTIEGVVAVIDSGLARLAGHSAWSGMPTLKISRVSKASAIQRAGRAGRVRAGRCLRLYTKHDFDTRPDHEAPEIRRLDLAEAALALHGSGVADLGGFGWYETPPEASLRAAEDLLTRLGALSGGALTEVGRKLMRFPVHPRQARVALEAQARGCGDSGAIVAALIGEREIQLRSRTQFGGGPRQAKVSGPSDLLEALEAFQQAERRGFDSAALRAFDLDARAVQAVDRVRKTLRGGARDVARKPEEKDRELLAAILAGFPDRVAKRRPGEPGRPSADLLLALGGTAKLSEQSVVRDAPWVVAVDAEERSEGARGGTVVRVASRIEPDWLLDLFPDAVRAQDEAVWNDAQQRAEAVSRLTYEQLVLEESRGGELDPEKGSELLARAALAKGPRAFAEEGELDRLVARAQVVGELGGDPAFRALTEADLQEALRDLCIGRRSFAELREGSLASAVLARLPPAQRATLERQLPDRLRLPGGRNVTVHYERGKPPWIESRLQDFFGMTATPVIAGGKIPLVIHLLAPNGRAVQVTSDLAGFWDRHYPAVRKELCRKYPRHSWPEDPRTAKPPEPRGRR